MKRNNTTNEKLEELAGISYRTITDYRNRRRNPSREKAFAICFALHLAPEISSKFLALAGIVLREDEFDVYMSILLREKYSSTVSEINDILSKDGFGPLTTSVQKTA